MKKVFFSLLVLLVKDLILDSTPIFIVAGFLASFMHFELVILSRFIKYSDLALNIYIILNNDYLM